MRSIPTVVVHETKPATEWILGAPVQKVSPTFRHAVVQRELLAWLAPWARGKGRVGPEWRFWLEPPGEPSRYLVPDIAYLSYERLPREARDEAEEPHIAPDVAFEVLSPGDRSIHVEHKLDVYLRAGARLVIMLDPVERTFRAVDIDADRLWTSGETFAHPALPGFELDLADFFATLDE